jgi:flagellar biosynthetic protein FliO
MMTSFGWTDWLSMMGSFFVVLGLLVATLLMLKKMGPKIGMSSGKRLKILEIQNLGARQKLILLSVNQSQILVGVSASSMTRLGEFSDSTDSQGEVSSEFSDDSNLQQKDQSDGIFSGILSKVLKK